MMDHVMLTPLSSAIKTVNIAGMTPSSVTDSVTITNTKVLGDAPAMAMGSLYQSIGNLVAMAAANAVYAQQQANVAYQAASTLGVTKLFSQNR